MAQDSGGAVLTTRKQLEDEVRNTGLKPEDFRYAVAGLIFDDRGRVLLQTRGPSSVDEVGKIEGIGGGIGGYSDLLEALSHEISTELFDARTNQRLRGFVIGSLLGWHTFTFKRDESGKTWPWVVATFLCRLHVGVKPKAAEPNKITQLRFYTLEEVHALPATDLSPWTIKVREEYRQRYGDRPYFRFQ